VNRQLDWQPRHDSSKEGVGTSFAPKERMLGPRLGTAGPKFNRRRFISGVFALLFVGCLSPTMPLPPPSRPTIDGPDSSGNVVLSGQIDDASYVYADNLSTGYSAGQALDPDTGEYRFTIGARVGDLMALYYRRGSDESLSRNFEIPEPNTTSAGANTNSANNGGSTATGGSTAIGGSTGN
jgi:hypothetical protein